MSAHIYENIRADVISVYMNIRTCIEIELKALLSLIRWKLRCNFATIMVGS